MSAVRVDNCYYILQYSEGSYYNINLPVYPDEISDNFSASWSTQQIVGRSSPISAYTGTDFRRVSFSVDLHRELLSESGNPTGKMETLLRTLEKSVYPEYLSQGLMPPVATFRFGDFYARGYVESVSFTWKKPIINNQYMVAATSISMACYPKSVISSNKLGSSLNPFKIST